jgi:hypothetical protein
MPYYIRILGVKLDVPSLQELQCIASPAVLEVENGEGDDWEQLLLKYPGGDSIALIEKNIVIEGALGSEELEEFIEEVGHYKPTSAAAWLQTYLSRVKVIYAFQFLSGTDTENGFDTLQNVRTEICNASGGILQADGESFSNESGYTILWQFSDHVTGDWYVAVRGKEEDWVKFQMDLGNQSHREAFWRGEVPEGVIPVG